MNGLSRPSDDLRAAVVLLGGVTPLLQELSPEQREKIAKLVTAATRRVMKVLFLLEPKRAKLAK